MSKRLSLYLLLFFIVFSSCKDKSVVDSTDNLYKFKDYISYHTNGQQSIASSITIVLAKPLEQYELNQELPSSYISIDPKTEGTLLMEDARTLHFQPSSHLEPNTEYKVSLSLGKLFETLPKEFNTYTFGFRTITPNFKIDLEQLQSYSKEWQYLEGNLEASDLLPSKDVKAILKASSDGNALNVKWEGDSETSQYFNFKIDSIPRKIDDYEIIISWDGSVVGTENKGEEKISIPGQNKFIIMDVRTTSAPNPMLSLNFSEPLDEKQNLQGLVTIENANALRFEINGNVLNVYPDTNITGQVTVNVFNGLKSSGGLKLKNNFSELVSFEQLKPEVRLISKGTVLPNANETPIYFETVNLSAVEVRVVQVFENNMLQYLQSNDLGYADLYNMKRVGRRVAYKVIQLGEQQKSGTNGQWKAHALDLKELILPNSGSLYRVEFSFKKEHTTYNCNSDNTSFDDGYANAETSEEQEIREQRFWDNELYSWRNYYYNWEERDNPCHRAYYNNDRVVSTNLLASDLGLIVKKGNNQSYHVIATNLLTARPEANTTVNLYNYQQQLMDKVTTDAEGIAIYDAKSNVAFIVAQKDNNYAYAKLEDGNALSMSKFDISGQQLQKGLQGFIYTERGVHRPGDPIHLTFVLNDKNNPLPENHPVVLEVTDPRGKLTQRTVLNSNDAAYKGELLARKENNFHYFPITTDADAPTGNWTAKILVGGAQFSKTLKVATVKPNRLKIALDFNDEILDANKNIKGSATSSWLHGAPARNLKIEIEATLRNTNTAFEKYGDYIFQDPIRSFDEITVPFLSTNLSAEGKTTFDKKIPINKKAPGMLQAIFTSKVFEGGGDFSMDVYTKNISPFSHFVGLKSPETRRYGSFYTDENTNFDVVSVNQKGEASSNRDLLIKVYKIEWRWWWSRGRDNLSRYENTTVHKPFKEISIKTNAQGKGSFDINVPDEEGGRYLIRVIDKASGHATGRTTYFYRNWWQRPTDGNSESAKMLIFSADKEKYEIGDEAVITFPSDKKGRALVSIENGTEVLSTQWIDTNEKETKAVIAITEEMAPNAYVNISLLQPHGTQKNDLPIRLYGIVPILVENKATILKPSIKMKDVLEPEKQYTVSVSEENKKPMTYTIAVVDEGLLSLTRYTTPNIHGAFYTRQALGVKTFDIFDDVMGAYSTSVNNIYSIGGGDMAAGAKNRKAQRFKPVVTYLGPFNLKAGEVASHKIDMPNYVGAVKTMVVAGNAKSAYGHTEKSTPVRKPLMVLASIPRKLSPGEKVTIPVTVFAMEKKVKSAQIKIQTGKALKAIGSTTKQVTFEQLGEKIVNFDFEVLPAKSFETIRITASGAGETASYEIEIDVENPNPISQKSTLYEISKNGSLTLDFDTFGTEGSNSATIELSTIPPLNLGRRMEYLVRYPHGCIEQTTSSVFPQLFLADVMDITFEKKKEIEKNITAAIRKIGNWQGTGGGLSYWPGYNDVSDWGTTYAGHFMIEAKQKGHALPLTFMSNWVRHQKKAARQWSNQSHSHNTTLAQAYRLYTLALAGEPELSAMNRLRESQNLSNNAKWRLAAAYAAIGKTQVAKDLSATANIDFVPYKYDYYTYGSPFRNRAMALETMVITNDPKQREQAVSLARGMSSKRWYSTQETAFALLALSKMVVKNGGKKMNVTLVKDGESTQIDTGRSMAQRAVTTKLGANKIVLQNNGENIIYVTLSQSGKLPLGQELTEHRNLTLTSVFLDGEGKKLDITSLQQGTEIVAQISVYNSSPDRIENVALTQIFPSGWEIVNTSFTDLGNQNSSKVDYMDIRDDRVNYYFNLGARKTKTFSIKLNTSYLGEYYLPGAQAEAMYDNDYFARSKGKKVTVVK